MDFEQWNKFNKKGEWTKEIDVRDFIQNNYKPYEGNDSFLTSATDATKKLWDEVLNLYKKERENGGVLDADTCTPSGVNAYDAGYIINDYANYIVANLCKKVKFM